MDGYQFLAGILVIVIGGFAAYTVLRQAIGDALKDWDRSKRK